MEPRFNVARFKRNTIRIKTGLPEEQGRCLKEAARTGVPFVEAFPVSLYGSANPCEEGVKELHESERAGNDGNREGGATR